MSCRCRDISKANRDIDKLYKVSADISDAIRSYRTMIEYHNDFLKKQTESFYLEDHEFSEIKIMVMQRDEDIEGKLEGYHSKLRNEIEALHREISSMEREDDDHHSDDDD